MLHSIKARESMDIQDNRTIPIEYALIQVMPEN